MKNLIAGRYIDRDSTIHRLDPRAKSVLLCAFLVYLIIWPNIVGHLLGLLLLVAANSFAKIGLKTAGRFLLGVRFFFYMTFLVHLLFTPGYGGFGWWIFYISADGAANGLLFGLRLVCLVWAAALFGWTTSPVSLADGIRKLLSPLKKLGLRVEDITTMLLLSMRFLPTLIRDTQELRLAQESRGAKFFHGSFKNRIESIIPLLIPLFVGAFRRAEATATALIVRGYELDCERTSLYPLEFEWRDRVSLAGAIIVVAIGIGGRMTLGS